jgi:hypothetical protein
MTKKYPSKVSPGLLLFISLVFFGPLIYTSTDKVPTGKMIAFIGFFVLVYIFILHLFLKTAYIIDNNQLKIKCGFFSFKPIDIHTIKEVSKTKSIMSSPAPSFDRIEIKYGKFDSILISPKDKHHFVKDLMEVNSNIQSKII